ncbi:MAG TPA: response regulator [Candidatus Manganitrophaceae bacterium]|nr:response regulator [Candidatus Manganitrophaceae bacterium]
MAKILVVDDVEANRYVMGKILTSEGFEVITADNGLSALERAKRERPDLILLDINMPDMDGFEVCRRLKDNAETEVVPILIVSATYQDLENRIHGIQLGAVDYLTEPVNKAELLARVKSHLRSKYYFDRSERDAKHFRELAEIGNLLFGSLTSDRFSPEITARIMDIFGAEGAALLYRSRPGEEIQWSLAAGTLSGLPTAPQAKEKPAEGLLAQAFNNKKTITLTRDEALADPTLKRWLDGIEVKHLLIAPLTYKQHSKGLLLLSRGEATLMPEEHAPLEILTSRLTAAFLNKEAYEYLHRLSDQTALRNIELQEELKENKTRLSYTSHDLKTPLNAIMGYASLLKSGTIDEQKRMPAVERILVNSRDLLRMIEKILQQAEESKTEPAEVDLVSVIQNQIENQLIPLLFGKEVDVVKEIEPGLKLTTSDPDLIKHILSNLFSNAAKFTATGTVSVSAKRASHREREGVQIGVSDTGVGIEPGRLDNIFKPFNHEPGYEGSGLGLSIVNEIVERMGGRIRVKSERGAGAAFSVWLPFKA